MFVLTHVSYLDKEVIHDGLCVVSPGVDVGRDVPQSVDHRPGTPLILVLPLATATPTRRRGTPTTEVLH